MLHLSFDQKQFGDWNSPIGLFVRFAVSCLIRHSPGLITFCEPVFLLLRHLVIHFFVW